MYGVISAEWIRGSGLTLAAPSRPWVARLTGLDERFGFRRDFVRGVYDYTRANGKRGGRGIYIYYALPPGLYEVYRPISWKHHERFFICVDDQGDIIRVTREEVEACLKNECSA